MKIGITGGTGLIGRYTVSYMQELGWEPVVFSRKEIDNVIQTNYTLDDLTHKFSNLDGIVHLASKRTASNFLEDYFTSISLTQNVFEACKRNNITNIVFASSISVYQQNLTLPWNESQEVAPKSMYGLSKINGELISDIYHEKHNLNIKSLRFAHVFGFNEQNNYMINLFMRQAFNKKTITLNSRSEGIREFLYAKDASLSIIKALLNKDKHGIYNIGSTNILSNEEVALCVNKVFNNNVDIVIKNPEKTDETLDSYMVHGLAKQELDFEAQYTMTAALEEIYKEMMGLENVPIHY